MSPKALNSLSLIKDGQSPHVTLYSGLQGRDPTKACPRIEEQEEHKVAGTILQTHSYLIGLLWSKENGEETGERGIWKCRKGEVCMCQVLLHYIGDCIYFLILFDTSPWCIFFFYFYVFGRSFSLSLFLSAFPSLCPLVWLFPLSFSSLLTHSWCYDYNHVFSVMEPLNHWLHVHTICTVHVHYYSYIVPTW